MLSMSAIEVPVGWDALRGEPAFTIRFEQPGTHIMLSEASLEKVRRVFGPVPFTASMAVGRAVEQGHADAPFTYHEHRPAMKACPYDPACRFV